MMLWEHLKRNSSCHGRPPPRLFNFKIQPGCINLFMVVVKNGTTFPALGRATKGLLNHLSFNGGARKIQGEEALVGCNIKQRVPEKRTR